VIAMSRLSLMWTQYKQHKKKKTKNNTSNNRIIAVPDILQCNTNRVKLDHFWCINYRYILINKQEFYIEIHSIQINIVNV
jgi:hypothetical protein